MAGQQITVRSGKYERLCGIIRYHPTSEVRNNIDNISTAVQINILKKLHTNQIIQQFNYQRPIFDVAAKEALKEAARITNSEHIRIYLHWDLETFERVLEILGCFVRKLTICGRKDSRSAEVGRVYQVLRRCPNVVSLRFRDFRLQTFNTELLNDLHVLDFKRARIPIRLDAYAFLKEFNAKIHPGPNCVFCNRATDELDQDIFIKFFKQNYQLVRVKLGVVLRHPVCGCDFKKSAFVDTVLGLIENGLRLPVVDERPLLVHRDIEVFHIQNLRTGQILKVVDKVP